MEFLNLGGPADDAEVGRRAPISKSKKKIFALVGVGVLAATIGVGTTLASSITLNNSGSVEFGQGIAATANCEGSDNITVTPLSSYDNSTTSFALSGVNLSGIDEGCEGKYLKISLWSANAAPMLDFAVLVPSGIPGTDDGATWSLGFDTTNGSSDTVTASDTTLASDTTFSVALSGITNQGAAIPSNYLNSITLESSTAHPNLTGEESPPTAS